MRSQCVVTLRPVTDMRATATRHDNIRCRAVTFAMSLHIVATMLALAALPVQAGDWPQFLGPSRNGATAEMNLASSWPKEGPPVLWQRQVGPGFSGPVISAGKLISFHRIGDKETVACLDAKTGKEIW